MEHFVDKPYGLGSRMMMQGVLFAELARIDGGISTFFTVQGCLAIFTMQALGSDE